MKFRKKPVVIDAVKWTGENKNEIFHFVGRDACWGDVTGMVIKTLEGEHKASEGDWIIRGVNGEHYPCKPDIFDKTYEAAE